MESTTVGAAKKILGTNFIGVDELSSIADKMNLLQPSKMNKPLPVIPYSEEQLLKVAGTHVLFLAIPFNAEEAPLSLMEMRDFFGIDPAIKEPCFYNQDWYVREQFVHEPLLEYRWYLLRKTLIDETRGKGIESDNENLPSALVCAYAFFVYCYHANKYLWESDFVWCNDTDANGDRVYVGRYIDPQGIAKNGFSIHRHLRLSKMYGQI